MVSGAAQTQWRSPQCAGSVASAMALGNPGPEHDAPGESPERAIVTAGGSLRDGIAVHGDLVGRGEVLAAGVAALIGGGV